MAADAHVERGRRQPRRTPAPGALTGGVLDRLEETAKAHDGEEDADHGSN
jgi:hypothetical protein